MRYTTKERNEQINRAIKCRLSYDDAVALRRIAMTLHTWFEGECGMGNDWRIERNEATNKPVMRNSEGQSYPIADRETGARKRLDALMLRYPEWRAYIQTDPRGGTIYLCRPDVDTERNYSQGVFIC